MDDQARDYQDRSGIILLGGVAQVLMPEKPSREGWGFYNNSTETLWVHLAGTASATRGIAVPSGTLLEMPPFPPPRGAISVYGATSGQEYTCWEW